VGDEAGAPVTMGHFATALFPYSKVKDSPAWLLLFCSQLSDFFWLFLAIFGIESPTPTNFLDVTIVGLKVTMPYSHTGAGTLALAAVTGGIVQGVWKNKALSIWCGVLVLAHWVQDLISGWRHEIFTVGTPKIGLGLYDTNPYVAFAIELAFAFACCVWFVQSEAKQGRPLTQRAKVILYAAFVGGSTMFIPTATHSFRTLLGL
jgi:hypothetical protein